MTAITPLIKYFTELRLRIEWIELDLRINLTFCQPSSWKQIYSQRKAARFKLTSNSQPKLSNCHENENIFRLKMTAKYFMIYMLGNLMENI
ncbi:CLUMA_CG021083, isoform A [Clunio marinus]|uniref:CLUMA_CG021083, isoform A n=1 Tax=Clunio marinus TaxID=568069 RepID=A0A1J1J6K7_9DIPT|nr:CLUMA_CG021083, isoform A [Clunio marinus]